MSILRVFKGCLECFNKGLRVFQGSFKSVSMLFQGYFKDISSMFKVSGVFKTISRNFKECFLGVL